PPYIPARIGRGFTGHLLKLTILYILTVLWVGMFLHGKLGIFLFLNGVFLLKNNLLDLVYGNCH
ncbi:hypothetical protein, partial [Yersinia enterocolitica]